MEHLGQNNMKELIAARIFAETKRLNDLAAEGGAPSPEDVTPFALDELRATFEDYGDEFLSDELLKIVLDEAERTFTDFKRTYPEGTNILVAALPCNINGTLWEEEDMKNGEYLTAFTLNESTGLSRGFGAITPTTHAKMLPKEIQDNCSFKVHYESDSPFADERDFKLFAEQYRRAYEKLRELLKG